MKKLFLLLFFSTALVADFPIISDGTTQITYLDAEQKEKHTITCYEQIEIDFNFNYLQCLSRNHDLKKQIHFHDALHDLYSDHLRATYIHNNGSLELDHLKIYGNVCLIQRENPSQVLAFDELQYALADQLEYDYKMDQMTLRAKEHTSVLYYDSINNYQIAAHEVTMKRDKESQKPIVQGVGKVRFAFQEDELEKFKKHFIGKGKDINDVDK